MQIDPAIKTKLQEFRTHLKAFEQAAGGVNVPASQSPSATSPSPAGAAPTTTAPEATSAPTATGTSGTSGVPGATGTSGTMAATPTGDQSKTAAERAGHSEADKHLDAIQNILNNAKDGKLDKSQTDQIKSHLEQLRQLIAQAK
jgi:hypothetical protein